MVLPSKAMTFFRGDVYYMLPSYTRVMFHNDCAQLKLFMIDFNLIVFCFNYTKKQGGDKIYSKTNTPSIFIFLNCTNALVLL